MLFLAAADFQADGIKALEEQKYEQAVTLFDQAIAADAKDYGAHFNRAFALSQLKKPAEAIAGYRRVLEIQPDLYEARMNLGVLLLEQKQAADAAALLREAAEQKPAEFRPRFYLAEALLEGGDNPGAEPEYRKAAELDPKSALAQLGLARAVARQGRLDDAAPVYKHSAELDLSFRDALLELAALYEKAKRPADAIPIYQQFPGNPAAQERLGELLIENKQFLEAIPRLEDAVKQSPTAANLLALATAYKQAGKVDLAMPLLERVVTAEPRNVPLLLNYGRMLRDQKMFTQAAAQFFNAAKVQPESVEAWNELVSVLILTANYPQALAALDKVKALGAEKAGHHFLRAITLDKFHQYPQALESYEKFLSVSTGQNPNEEFQARQRVRIIKRMMSRR